MSAPVALTRLKLTEFTANPIVPFTTAVCAPFRLPPTPANNDAVPVNDRMSAPVSVVVPSVTSIVARFSSTPVTVATSAPLPMSIAAEPVTCSATAARMSRSLSRPSGSFASAVASVQFIRGVSARPVTPSLAEFSFSVPLAYSSKPLTPISCASLSATDTPT